jgi:hypothetical protein
MYCLGNYSQALSICQQMPANVTKPRKTPGSLSPHHPSFKSNSSNVHTDPAPTMPRHLRTHSSSNQARVRQPLIADEQNHLARWSEQWVHLLA